MAAQPDVSFVVRTTNTAKVPAFIPLGPRATSAGIRLWSSSSSKFRNQRKESQERSCFPCQNPTAAAPGEAGQPGAWGRPSARQRHTAAQGIEVWSLCLVAFWRQTREPPWQTRCFTESPCGRSLSAESICRGGSAAWRRVQPAKHRAFSSGCHASGLPVLLPRDLLAPARNKRMSKHSAP